MSEENNRFIFETVPTGQPWKAETINNIIFHHEQGSITLTALIWGAATYRKTK